ncbi:MAG: ATP-binding protein [Candidatus Manganitrophaceae bacterium]|nr:MAG: ATP-binding protein [Candidatus Manganitrophaceae bacterium]
MSSSSFPSRIGLVENLRNHLLAGHWAAMFGGPMIGKTTLARRLAEELNNAGGKAVSLQLPLLMTDTAFWPLLLEALLQQGIGPTARNPFKKPPAALPELMSQLHLLYEKAPSETAARPVILILDDCDHLLRHAERLIPQIVNLALESTLPSIQAICWVGGAAFADWVAAHPAAFKLPLRLYPLSVIPIREARRIIREQLGPAKPVEEIDRIWNETGGHPLLMEQAFHPESPLSTKTLQSHLRQTLRPEDDVILDQLDPGGRWTLLDALKGPQGEKIPKPALDRLCMLGLTVRTLIDGVAAIRLTSPRFARGTEK